MTAMDERDIPIFMSVWNEWEARTGPFAKFALDEPPKVLQVPIDEVHNVTRDDADRASAVGAAPLRPAEAPKEGRQ
jgi:hypothetical protein